EACDAGKVVVNGKIARASYDVKQGDIIEITLGTRTIKVRVTEVKEVVRKEDADSMYEAVV
ncbi:MAG: RNA-binding S4 domain-containing protein, partial [Ruminococcus sp.]|nr:RNA-binding S4 domain-containing protein [Ruminococcus sp.]